MCLSVFVSIKPSNHLPIYREYLAVHICRPILKVIYLIITRYLSSSVLRPAQERDQKGEFTQKHLFKGYFLFSFSNVLRLLVSHEVRWATPDLFIYLCIHLSKCLFSNVYLALCKRRLYFNF